MQTMQTMRYSVNPVGLTEKPGKNWTWDEYNGTFRVVEGTTFDLLDAVSHGHSFAPVIDGRRKQENFIEAWHIGVDMDTHDKRSRLDHILRHEWVAAYACLVYPTLSATEDDPRSRIVFALDEPIRSLDGYRAAIWAVSQLFPGYDKSCVDPVRHFFGNGKIARDKLWDDTYYNDIRLPLSVVRLEWAKRRKQYQDDLRPVTSQQRPATPAKSQGNDMTLAELFGKLRQIDPYSFEYGEWFQLGCAIAHVYGDSAMFPFISWSNVPGRKAMGSKKWASMAADHPRPSNYGTIVALLRRKGIAA